MRLRRLTTVLPLALVLALLAPGTALAATNFFYVQGTGDPALAGCQPIPSIDGYRRCDSLRAAVDAANANVNPEGETDLIFLQATGAYQLTQAPELTLSDDVTIVGRGPRTTSIQGNGSARVLSIPAGVTAGLLRVAIAGGRAPQGNGGNISNSGSLVMIGVRITGGSALAGGGVANSGVMSISNGLIDSNEAASSGGGILNVGGAAGAVLTVVNTTVAFNRLTSGTGAGIATSGGNAQSNTSLVGVTIARNTIQGAAGSGAGIAIGTAGEQMAIYGSIVAGNTIASGAVSNCAGPGTLSDGTPPTSFADDSTCGLALGVASLSPGLVDAGGDTDVLTFPPDGFAKGRVSPCFLGNDQRNAPRAAGGTCDAGAFEEGAVAPPVDSGPAIEPVVVQPPSFVPTVVPPPPPTPPPTPTPTPTFNKTVVVKLLSGRVLVRRPGSQEFTEVDASEGIPLGSTVDTKKGVIELTSLAKPGGAPQKAKLFDGIFKVTQSRGITDFTLDEPLAACKKASAAAKKPKSRKLWGDGKGKFRTRGQYSAATVRGTKWLVQDSCAGTHTRVTQGSVSVRDNVRKMTILLRAGKRYLARPTR